MSEGLISIETNLSVPFEVKRVYYLYNISNDLVRGEHAHKELYQLIIGLNEGFRIILDDGRKKKDFFLSNPNEGLLIVPGIWRILSDFSKDSVCLVLASDYYKESDYIRDYQKFLNYKR